MRNTRQLQIAVSVLVIAVYAAARFWRLTDACLWFDEIFSIHAAEHGWGEILNFVALDLIHPPLFYVLLKLWIAVGGESLFWLRFFPVLFSLLAVFPFLRLCNELKVGKWTRLLALLLFAVNGSLIKYSQEVRMYAPLMCLSLFSMWLFARYFIKGKSFVALVIVNVLMVYTHYFGWFIVVTEVVLILWFQRIKWCRIVVMFGIVLAAFLPWLVAVVMASRGGSELGQNIGWMSRPGLREVWTLVLNLVEPFYAQLSTAQPMSIFAVSIPLLLILAGATAAWWPAIFRRTADDNVLALLAFVKIPILLCLAASWLLPYSIWGTRHLIIVFAPLCICLAVAVRSIADKRLRVGAVTLVLLLGGYAGLLHARREVPVNSWCAWDQLTTSTGNVPVYATEDLIAYHVWFARREGGMIYRVSGIDGIAEDTAYFLPRGFNGVERVDAAVVSDRRIWVAFRAQAISESEPPLRDLLLSGYRVLERRSRQADSETAALFLLEK